jgi:hypothetical protein
MDSLSTSASPTATLLAAYHAILAWSSAYSCPAGPVLLCDRLAAYHDQGGGVVIAAFTSLRLLGAYSNPDNSYALTDRSDYALGEYSFPKNELGYFSDSLGDVMEPNSRLMAGVGRVASLTASTGRGTAPVIAGCGVVVARWRDGEKEPE